MTTNTGNMENKISSKGQSVTSYSLPPDSLLSDSLPSWLTAPWLTAPLTHCPWLTEGVAPRGFHVTHPGLQAAVVVAVTEVVAVIIPGRVDSAQVHLLAIVHEIRAWHLLSVCWLITSLYWVYAG